jgi:hypothetical protein
VSVIEQSFFATFAPYFKIEPYKPDNHRHRIEMRKMPPEVQAAAVAVTMPCVACGRQVHPFRARDDGDVYFAATCPLDVNTACARGRAARDEYKRVVVAIGCPKCSPKASS